MKKTVILLAVRRLLIEAKQALETELSAMGEDEWKQHPIYVSNAKLCDRIEKILKENTRG